MSANDKAANQWAMFVHFSLFAGFMIPIAGWVLPIILWQIKKDEYPIVDIHGKIVVNWLISAAIYCAVSWLLVVLLIGFLGFAILAVLGVVFPIIGGIKASQGEVWEYPLTIKLIR